MKQIKNLFGFAAIALAIVVSMAALLAGCGDGGGGGGGGGNPVVINIYAIPGVTAPVSGATPVTAITPTEQYTGTITWKPAVSDTFAAKTNYTATITLKAKPGFTLTGVEADFFKVKGAEATNDADSGVITAKFPKTAGTEEDPAIIDDAVIEGVAVPVTGAAPVRAITGATQFTGTVTWEPAVSDTFAAEIAYTATITLTAKPGFTLTGVTENFFTVKGAEATNDADSGVITAVFPETSIIPTYGISLSSTGTHVFTIAEPGYAAQTPLTVTVTNIGDQATGALTVALSGTNAANFTVSTTSISSIAVGGTGSFTVAPATNLAVGSYTAVVTVSGGNGITASFNVSFAVETPILYIINGSGVAFTATRETVTVGTPNQPIQDVINAIRSDAAGNWAIIQFGDKTNVLDIGTANITFNAAGDEIWGAVTLSGKITSKVSTNTSGVIIIADAVSVTSTADIANTSSGGAPIRNTSTGTLTITNGEISATNSVAVYNSSTGTVTITGGTISVTGESGVAVYNNITGTVTITGGTISLSTTGMSGGLAAVYNNNKGTVTITGGTISATGPNTIAVYNSSGCTVTITDGTISQFGGTQYPSTGAAISNGNGLTNTITITGGEISSSGVAVANNNTSTVTITGGTVSATGGEESYAVQSLSTGKITVSGTALITSANTNATQGTIQLRDSGTATDVRLEITGGTVQNTSTTTGNAIYNASTGAVSITGGTVSKAGSAGYAINNAFTGVVTIGEGATIEGEVKITE